jgi:hypothetical protein
MVAAKPEIGNFQRIPDMKQCIFASIKARNKISADNLTFWGLACEWRPAKWSEGMWPPSRISHFRFGQTVLELIPIEWWTSKLWVYGRRKFVSI